MKVKQRTCIKNLKTMTFWVEEEEIDIPVTLDKNFRLDRKNSPYLEGLEVNNISCALEVQKLIESGWVYGKPPEIKSKKKKNFIKNCFKRLGL